MFIGTWRLSLWRWSETWWPWLFSSSSRRDYPSRFCGCRNEGLGCSEDNSWQLWLWVGIAERFHGRITSLHHTTRSAIDAFFSLSWAARCHCHFWSIIYYAGWSHKGLGLGLRIVARKQCSTARCFPNIPTPGHGPINKRARRPILLLAETARCWIDTEYAIISVSRGAKKFEALNSAKSKAVNPKRKLKDASTSEKSYSGKWLRHEGL